MSAAQTNPSIRARVLAKLREYAAFYRAREQYGAAVPPHSVPTLAHEIAPIDPYGVWLVIHDLTRVGVIIPGQRNYMRVDSSQLRAGDQSDLFNWPFFTITPFGLDYLESVEAATTA
jgi:hypothetical protein